MKLPVAFLTAAAIGLTGCMSGLVGPLPVTTPATAANVHVMRISTIEDITVGFRILYDQHKLFNINNGEAGSFQVPPGRHDIAVECFGGLVPIIHTYDLQENFVAGQDYYFQVQPGFINCASIQSMTADQGRSMIPGMTPVSLSNN
jgi:hypothetical protein